MEDKEKSERTKIKACEKMEEEINTSRNIIGKVMKRTRKCRFAMRKERTIEGEYNKRGTSNYSLRFTRNEKGKEGEKEKKRERRGREGNQLKGGREGNK